MPHVIVKMYAGRSDTDKKAMADRTASALYDTMGYRLGNVSVAVEEIDPSDPKPDPFQCTPSRRAFCRDGATRTLYL